MEKKSICIDTSILIDYFRKTKKSNSKLIELSKEYLFSVSVITKLEVMSGSTEEQIEFWKPIFSKCNILPITEMEIDFATEVVKKLRKANNIIELPDILIAATAVINKLPLATLNKKHFSRISEVEIMG